MEKKTSDYYAAVSFVAAAFAAIIVYFANHALGLATFAALTSINCAAIAAGYIAQERTQSTSATEHNDKKE